MSVSRSMPSTPSEGVSRSTQVRPTERAPARTPPPGEAVERFRQLMGRGDGNPRAGVPLHEGAHREAHAGAQAATTEAPTPQQALPAGPDAETGSGEMGGGDTMAPAELAALMQAQLGLREPAGPVAVPLPQAAPTATAFAELLERQVRQMLVSAGGIDAHGNGEVLLRMSDATLPGTDLTLARGPEGWVLRADVRSRDSYEAIQRAAPELARRFAERNLGELSIEPRFDG
ncbi:hypothetical protein [Coralloluteibacterium thermophilus]|uniref:Flagellar hook-length control protein FliK n=1 Tax=Coralloluteibacterium thermophilum TaxID=2707049 RepID=A0ABV9NRX6_9GAMM